MVNNPKTLAGALLWLAYHDVAACRRQGRYLCVEL